MIKDRFETVKRHFDESPYTRDRWVTHSKSSLNLIDWLQELNPNLVLDVGCGTNPFKEHVRNVIGMDLAEYPEADLRGMSAEAVYEAGIFQDECADVVMALGSINFGDWEDIVNQITICTKWCKPGGYMVFRARLNDHTERNLKNKGFHQHGWQMEDIYKLTETLGDSVEFYKEPEIETAAGGRRTRGEDHGKPDHSRSINLAVWYWRKK